MVRVLLAMVFLVGCKTRYLLTVDNEQRVVDYCYINKGVTMYDVNGVFTRLATVEGHSCISYITKE